MGKLSAVEMLAEKYDQKAILKEREIKFKKMELQFQVQNFEKKSEERAPTGTGDAGTKGNVRHSKQDKMI